MPHAFHKRNMLKQLVRPSKTEQSFRMILFIRTIKREYLQKNKRISIEPGTGTRKKSSSSFKFRVPNSKLETRTRFFSSSGSWYRTDYETEKIPVSGPGPGPG